MATADEQKMMEMVPDHERRLKKLEAMLADKMEAQALEDEFAERYPETVPQRAKKDDKPKK